MGFNCELLVLVHSMSAKSWQNKPMDDCITVKRDEKCLLRLAGQGKMSAGYTLNLCLGNGCGKKDDPITSKNGTCRYLCIEGTYWKKITYHWK